MSQNDPWDMLIKKVPQIFDWCHSFFWNHNFCLKPIKSLVSFRKVVIKQDIGNIKKIWGTFLFLRPYTSYWYQEMLSRHIHKQTLFTYSGNKTFYQNKWSLDQKVRRNYKFVQQQSICLCQEFWVLTVICIPLISVRCPDLVPAMVLYT